MSSVVACFRSISIHASLFFLLPIRRLFPDGLYFCLGCLLLRRELLFQGCLGSLRLLEFALDQGQPGHLCIFEQTR